MVLVVLDSPRLVGVDEGSHHDSANDVLHELVLKERLVSAVMADDKELRGKEKRNGQAE